MFSKYFVAIHEIKLILTLNQPISVGFRILDLNKLLMYEFRYRYFREKYDKSGRLLFTDTDSLVSKIETDDVYGDFYEN